MKKKQLRQLIKQSVSDSSHLVPKLKKVSDWIANHKIDNLLSEVESWDEDYVNKSLSSKEFEKHKLDNGWDIDWSTKDEIVGQLQDLKYESTKLEESTNKIIWDIIYDSKGKVNCIDMDQSDWEMIEVELKKKDELKQNKISQDIELIVDAMPIAMELVQQEYSMQFSDLTKERIMPIVASCIVKQHNRKLGQKHKKLEDRNKRIAEALKPYWDWKVNDIEMPDNHNRDSLFETIANEFGIGFERIKQIERELFKEYAPKESDWNDPYK